MCHVCSLTPELCGCPFVLTEPRVESLENLCELKLEERERSEFLPIPKLNRQTNILYLFHDEPLICDHELLAISTFEEPKILQVYELEDGEIYESNETKNKEAAANFIAKYNI
jgi:hypothetical protein